MRRIFYLVPDFRKPLTRKLRIFVSSLIHLDLGKFIQVFDKPDISGGIKMLFYHCDILNKLGFCARPLLLGEYIDAWFEHEVRSIRIKEVGYELKMGDIIVCPELILYDGLKFKHAKKILFAQNWILVNTRIRKEDLNKNYYDIGYDGIITCSKYMTDYLHDHGRGEAVTITNGIDHSKFIYRPERKKANRILWLSRKNPDVGYKIIKLVRKKEPSAVFVRKSGLSEKEIIEEYQRADIFLSTGYPEGFSLPSLEAMACGCAVVGFTGKGADEFMIDRETAIVAPDGDTYIAAQKLIELLGDRNLKEHIRLGGYNKAKEYNMERMKQDLYNFYRNL